jgi:serine/threonine protein kinase
MLDGTSRTGARIGDRYELVEEIGKGAHGRVYRGLDTKTHGSVAVKEISLERLRQSDISSIMSEVELLKSLNHRNIVQYLGSFQTRQYLYIIMELVEAGSLAFIVRGGTLGPFPEALIGFFADQILQGLAYLHSMGITHRDIKGANILTNSDGLVKLADFGVAAKLSGGEEEAKEREASERDAGDRDAEGDAAPAGTPYWMAPEVVELKNVTVASDIWSVGCVVIELLTGRPPYFDLQPLSAMYNIVQDPHPPLPGGISDRLEDFLLQCFSKDPMQRPSAEELTKHSWIVSSRKTIKSIWADSSSKFDATIASVIDRLLATEPVSSPSKDEATQEFRDPDEWNGGLGCSGVAENGVARRGETRAGEQSADEGTDFQNGVCEDATGTSALSLLQKAGQAIFGAPEAQGAAYSHDAAELVRQVASLRLAATSKERSLVQEAAAAASARTIDGYISNNATLGVTFYQADGLSCIREMLDSHSERLVAPCFDLLLTLVDSDVKLLHHACSLGVIPAAMRFALKNFSLDLRRRAAQLAKTLVCGSAYSTTFFVACQGIPFAMALMEGDENDLELSFAAISVFWVLLRRSLAGGPGPQAWPNQYLRLMAHHDLPSKLSSVIKRALESPEQLEDASKFLAAAVNLFAALAHGDKVVKARCSRPATASVILEATIKLPVDMQRTILAAFVTLTTDESTIQNLEESNGVAYAVAQLSREDAPDLQVSGVRALEHMCLLSRTRLDKASTAGAVPWLCRIAASERDAGACSLLSSMVHGSPQTREALWDSGAFEVLVDLLEEKACVASSLEALVHWLECDVARLEPKLLERSEALLRLLPSVFEAHIECQSSNLSTIATLMTSLIARSPAIGLALADAGLAGRAAGLLSVADAPTSLALLDLMKTLADAHPDPRSFLDSHGEIRVALEELAAQVDNPVVREKARSFES